VQEPATIRILLVDDQPLFRKALATLIDGQPDLSVIGEAENGLQAVEQARALQPDLVVMDVDMPVMNGVEAVRLIREQVPAAKVVMLTVSESEDDLFDAVRFGAHGYLLKDLRPEQLYDMLRSVMRNETPLSPAIAGRVLAALRGWGASGGMSSTIRSAPSSQPEGPQLTRREIEIGSRLNITEGTVKNHVHNSLEKLHLENRIQAAAYVVRQGMGHRPDPS
jgi:two-component system nitrate/nitrite response regulator NarL